ncbi:MAG: PQQ-dependent sugar dehydrogenase [Cytophagales bacterium]|nr:MAG: PQQ-dependent sugar dehydrogenase [Cytophagales bacterium]
MKQLIVLLLLIPAFLATAQPQPDRAAIETVLNQYFDGWMTGDTTRLGYAMHQSCQLKNYLENEKRLVYYSRADYLRLFRPRARDPRTSGRIVSVDITAHTAGAKIELNTAWDTFTDYFNLMRIDGRWYIVDKISSRRPHPTAPVNPQKETVMDGINRPWSMAFLNEDEALITEKQGDLVRVNLRTKQKFVVKNFPTDMADSMSRRTPGDNTGKFEVVLDPSFNSNKFVYISYAAQNETGMGLKVIRAVFENDALQQIKSIFTVEPFTPERHHYGGGMIFGADGKLYITAGERLFTEASQPPTPLAQDVQDKRGKIYRINPDGSIPADNPDFGKGAVPGLYAVGIRAAQGLALEPTTNRIWFSEHGTHQGDEINILKAGVNYGWPVVTTGKYRYETYKPAVTEGATYTDPIFAWTHTVAPTGLVFYRGEEFPTWKNSLIIPGLSRGSLWRMTVNGEQIIHSEELFVNDRVRSRKVVQSPAGRLYMLTDETNGKIVWIKNAR